MTIDTCSTLCLLLVSFVRGQGDVKAVASLPACYDQLAAALDSIGWAHFLCGMIPEQLVALQREHLQISGLRRSINKWADHA